VSGGWRKLHDEELHYLYNSPRIIRIIKSRRMRWAWYIARMVARRKAYRVFVGIQKERDHQEDLNVGGRITLKWILEK
jgi:hypothetical protein